MNPLESPLVLLAGGGAVAYLLLRHHDAAAATSKVDPGQPPGSPPPPVPPAAPSAPVIVTIPTPTTLQITTPAPRWPGEVAPRKPPAIPQLPGRWGWPVPRWGGRAPVISDGFGSPRPGMTHQGVDLMFARVSTDPFPNGPNGSKAFVMPDAWMAIAASDGVLWSSGRTPRGYAVVLDHGHVCTFYQHLETLLVPETKPPAKGVPSTQLLHIKAGQPLGVIGGDPLNAPHLKHLHFELWVPGPSDAVDPKPVMQAWQVFGPDDVKPFLSAMTRNAAKKRTDFVSVRGYERRWPGTALNPPR